MATERELNILIKARDHASHEMEKLQGHLHDINEGFMILGGAMVAAGAAGLTGLGAAVKVAADFEAQMSQVGAIADASKTELSELTAEAQRLGETTKFSASEAAEGMQYLAQNGFATKEIILAMPGVLDAAAASGMGLARTAEVVSGTLRGFQMEASASTKVADVMAKVANTSAADMGSLGDTMKFVAPIAKAAGFSFEDISAAAGIMGNAMIKGSEAGTDLRGMIMRLQAPTDDAAKLMEQYGINVRDSQGYMKPLPDIISEFENAFKGLNKEQQDNIIKSAIGMEAAAGFQVLLNEGSDALRNYSGELQNAGGSAAETAKKMQDNLKGSIEKMKSAFEGVAITIGQQLIPYVRAGADALGMVFDWFNNLSPAAQALITKIILFVSVFSLLAGGILLVASIWPMLAAAFIGLTGPVGIAIAIIGALVAAVVFGWDQIKAVISANSSQIQSVLSTAWTTIQTLVTAAAQGVAAIIKWAWPYIQQIISAVMNNVVPFLVQMWGKINSFIQSVIPPIVKIITWAWQNVIEPLITSVMNRLIPVITAAWNVIKGVISGAMDIVMGVIKTVLNLITGNWSGAWEGIKQILSGAWTVIKTVAGDGIKLVWSVIKNGLGLIKDGIATFAKAAFQMGKDLIMGLVNGIKAAAGKVADAAKAAVKGAIDGAKSLLGINSPSRVFMEIGNFTSEGFAKGIQGAANLAIKASKKMAEMTTDPLRKISKTPEQLNAIPAGSGRSGSSNNSNQIILQFGEGSVVLPDVKDGKGFVNGLQGFSMRQAFKIQ